MYSTVRGELESTLAEIRAAGLYKTERQLASPQSAHVTAAGRSVLNFSEWNRGNSEAGEAAETVRDREMPPTSYLLLHPEARLTAPEREQLARGLDATLATTTRQSRAD